MKGTTNAGNCSGSTHFQASNSGCWVARLTSASPHRKPFLAVSAITPAHYSLGNLLRYVVIKPAAAFGKDVGSTGADLLSQLTQCRLTWSFVSIDAALRHLPPRQPRRHADAVIDEG
jgi:hypothetical protein